MAPSTISNYLAFKLTNAQLFANFHFHFRGLPGRPRFGFPVLLRHRFRRRNVFFLGNLLGTRRSFPHLTVSLFSRTNLVELKISIPSGRLRALKFPQPPHPIRLPPHRIFFY